MENFKGRKVQQGPRGGTFVMVGSTKKYVPMISLYSARIGSGANGAVWQVSPKIVAKTFSNSASGRAEINMMLHLRKARFVPKIHYYQRSVPIYFMNSLPSGTMTLWKWLKHPHTDAQIKNVYKQIHDNVDTLHRKFDVSHGDLHSENIMVDPKGKVWIIDFGRSQRLWLRGENEVYNNSNKSGTHNGVTTYNFGFLARKNANMLKKYPL